MEKFDRWVAQVAPIPARRTVRQLSERPEQPRRAPRSTYPMRCMRDEEPHAGLLSKPRAVSICMARALPDGIWRPLGRSLVTTTSPVKFMPFTGSIEVILLHCRARAPYRSEHDHNACRMLNRRALWMRQ